jgi:hypothetical protein
VITTQTEVKANSELQNRIDDESNESESHEGDPGKKELRLCR